MAPSPATRDTVSYSRRVARLTRKGDEKKVSKGGWYKDPVWSEYRNLMGVQPANVFSNRRNEATESPSSTQIKPHGLGSDVAWGEEAVANFDGLHIRDGTGPYNRPEANRLPKDVTTASAGPAVPGEEGYHSAISAVTGRSDLVHRMLIGQERLADLPTSDGAASLSPSTSGSSIATERAVPSDGPSDGPSAGLSAGPGEGEGAGASGAVEPRQPSPPS